jgi:agmatine/peptidylarginine deiminase
MLTWPHARSDWAACLDEVETTYSTLVQAVSRHEKVLIVCRDETHRADLWARLTALGIDPMRLRLHIAPSNDTWARDHGPITVRLDGRSRLLDFSFNGWGGKYPATFDNAITARLHATGAFGEIEREDVALVLEGGSIETDGAGTLLTTGRCLLSRGRNPDLGQEEIEARLKTLLGIERIFWLEHGIIPGDDTDGHIDNLARYCDANSIAYVTCDERADEAYAELKAMERELMALRTRSGEPYRLVPLPWPRPIYGAGGHRLPASYANFLIINGAVLLPAYDDPADSVARERLAQCFPGRELLAINARVLIEQYGSLHCAGMQLPEGVLR